MACCQPGLGECANITSAYVCVNLTAGVLAPGAAHCLDGDPCGLEAAAAAAAASVVVAQAATVVVAEAATTAMAHTQVVVTAAAASSSTVGLSLVGYILALSPIMCFLVMLTTIAIAANFLFKVYPLSPPPPPYEEEHRRRVSWRRRPTRPRTRPRGT